MKQYFIYGVLVSTKWLDNWKKINSDFDLELFTSIEITSIFYGKDNEFVIVGKILDNPNDDDTYPIIVPELNNVEKCIIESSVMSTLNIQGDFHYYFVKNM